MSVEKSNLPAHIAIIMDGNRRWAKEKKQISSLGHKEGAKTLEKIVRYANKIGIPYLTVYAFSTENWKRTKEEVGALMMLLQAYLEDFSKRVDTENIRFRFIGNIGELPESVQKSMKNVMERTKNNTGVNFNVAFNYGGRAELTKAMKEIAEDVKQGKIQPEDISEETISNHLYTAGMPDPDLLIRTANELRTSNFLPWQIVYSEFLFIDKYWPDFSEKDLDNAIFEYKKRNRKFGADTK